MATFSSWSALRTQLLDDLVSTNTVTRQYSIGGRQHVLRSVDEIKALLDLCDKMIAATGGQAYTEVAVRFTR